MESDVWYEQLVAIEKHLLLTIVYDWREALNSHFFLLVLFDDVVVVELLNNFWAHL